MRTDAKERINSILRGNIPGGYRKTEFGILPMGWEYRKFEELFVESSVFTSDTKKYPLYSLTIENGVTPKTERYEREFLITKDEDNYKIVCENEFVYNPMNLRFGSLAYHSGKQKVSVSRYYNVFSITGDYTPAYIKAFLLSERMMHHYDVVAIGSLKEKRRVHFSQFLQFSVPMPAVEEANKIGEFLFTWDRAIELKEKLLEQKKLQEKGLIQQILHQCFAKCKCKEIKEIAKQRIEINSNNKSFPVLSCTKYNGLVSSLEYFQRQVYSENLEKYKVVRKKWFAYATNHIEEGSIGLQLQYDAGVVSPMYTVFELNIGMDEEFVFAILKTETYRRRYENMMNASVNRRGSLRWNDFSKIKIPVPEYEMQKKMAEIIRFAENEISLLEEDLKLLKAQKKGLMQLLLTGKVRVPC